MRSVFTGVRQHQPSELEARTARKPGDLPRVLIVTNMYPSPEYPSSGIFVQRQVESLRANGLAAEVLFLNRRVEGVRVYLKLRGRLKKARQMFRPDLIHVMYGGAMANEVTRLVRDVPVIVSFCGSDLIGDGNPGFSRLCDCYSKWASHRAAALAAGVVVKSEGLLRAFPKRIRPSRVKIIPNGVDLERFRPIDRKSCCLRLGWDPDRFNVLMSNAAGDPVKRPWLARAAVAELERRGMRAELHEMTSAAPQEVPLWINAADCVIITSKHEGSPNIVKECLACNVPLVSVEVGDVAERIAGVRGCYLAQACPEALADKLALVYSGLRRVESRVNMQSLSLECVARQIIDFYREIVCLHNGCAAERG